MTATDLALLAARFLHLAPLVQALGALAFVLVILPRAERAGDEGRDGGRAAILRLVRGSLLLSLAGGLLWLQAQAAAMAGGDDPVRALALVLSETDFGATVSLRFLLLLAAAGLAWRNRPRPAAAAAAAALLLQPWLGHGAAADSLWLPLGTAVHVLAASLWLGALAPLWIALRASPAAGAAAARRFSALGLACVAALAATAVAQAPLIGDVPRFIGTPYGGVAGGKLLLFAGLLALAAANRFVLVPRALAGQGRGLRTSVLLETLLGLAVLALAAGLASLPPAAHAQPVWPFSLRPVPTLWEDAFLRDRIVRTLGPLLAVAGFAVAALLWRRGRWPLAGASLAAILWVPDFPLKPYVRAAFPTSFQSWERSRTPAALHQSAALFQAECAPCHAADARGRGPLATGTPAWPPDLTAPLYRRDRDGDLFWHIGAGMALPDGTPTMPGFRDRLAADEIWGLVDYLRARGSARSLDGDGRWGAPPRAPTLIVQCVGPEGGAEADPARPAGALLYVDAGAAPGTPALPASEDAGLRFCRLDDPDARADWLSALAILTERPPEALQGAAVLIDGQGWLRRVWPAPPSAADLAAEAARTRQTPVSQTGGHHT